MKFDWKKTKKLTAHLILTSICFKFLSFSRANLILVPFPTQRKQVLPISCIISENGNTGVDAKCEQAYTVYSTTTRQDPSTAAIEASHHKT